MRRSRQRAAAAVAALFAVQSLHGQASRTGPEWTTAGMDAQRSRAVPADPQIFVEALKQPGFGLLWKVPLLRKSEGTKALSEPVLVNTFIGYKGFKALAVVGAKNALFAVDYDLGRPYWEKHFDVPGGTPSCAAGMAVASARLTPLVPPPIIGAGMHGGYHSAVSKAGEGVPLKAVARVPAAAAVPPPAPASTQTPAPANAAAPNGPGIGGASGPGGVPADAGPITGPVRTGPPPGTGLYKGSQPIFAVSSDGMLHAVSQGSSKELQKPAQFVPAGSGLYSLIDVDGTVYAATRSGCGAAPDSVFAMDVSVPDKRPASWASPTGPILGAPAFAASGTVVVTTQHALVALRGKTLQVAHSTQGVGTLHSPPVIFTLGGTELAAVAASGGRLLLQEVDKLRPGVALAMATPDFAPDMLATWADEAGTRWLLASDKSRKSGGLRAFRIKSSDGRYLLEDAWQADAIATPGAPIVINGVVFALSTGQIESGTTGKAQAAARARVYALEASSGKELWNSGSSMAAGVDSSALAFSPGQIYVGGTDGTLYAFGFPVPRQELAPHIHPGDSCETDFTSQLCCRFGGCPACGVTCRRCRTNYPCGHVSNRSAAKKFRRKAAGAAGGGR